MTAGAQTFLKCHTFLQTVAYPIPLESTGEPGSGQIPQHRESDKQSETGLAVPKYNDKFNSDHVTIVWYSPVRGLWSKQTVLISFKSIASLRARSSKVRMLAVQHSIRASRTLLGVKSAAVVLAKNGVKAARRRLALIYRRMILVRYGLQTRLARHGRVAIGVTLAAFIVVGFVLAHVFQTGVEAYFNPERFILLRNLLATTGGALVGATAKLVSLRRLSNDHERCPYPGVSISVTFSPVQHI